MADTAKKSKRRRGGFTLLEVMLALAVLGMSLSVLIRSQQLSVRAANRSKLMTVAVMLARYTMVEVEDKLFEDGFSDFNQEESGDFDEEGFKRYSYTLKVDKVELPTNVNAESFSSMLGGGSSGDSSGSSSSGASSSGASSSPVKSMGSAILGKQFNLIKNVLEQAIRRVSVKVEWKEGKRKRHVAVVGYFTDPRKVDMAASGQLTSSGSTQNPTGAQPPGTGPTQLFRTGSSSTPSTGSSTGGTR